jgi:hypothetical protein
MKHAGWVSSVCFFPDFKKLAGGASGATVLWNVKGIGCTSLSLRHVQDILVLILIHRPRPVTWQRPDLAHR